MIILVAKSRVIDDKVDEYKVLAEELVNESRKEAGCISYNLVHNDSTGEFAFVEQWKDDKAIELHNNSQHFKTIVPRLGELRECKANIERYEVII